MAESLTSKRLIGVVVPVGALRGKDSIGIGEFPDLIEFAELCVKMKIGIIQLLPVNDTGYESSPYSALTAFALNPIYLRLKDIPEADGFKDAIAALGERFEKEERFPYYKIAKEKMRLLRDIFDLNKAAIERDVSIDVWIKKNIWVKNYAVFRRLKEANEEKSWKDWKAFNKVSEKELEGFWNDPKQKNAHLFWCWIQYHLDKQFTAAADKIAALGIILKGDLPILLNEDSADVWAHPEYFHENLAAGAPPDMYNMQGQNWGFPLYNWQAQANDDFTWWKARLTAAKKYFKAYRIDHVLGFFRIWACSHGENSALLGRYIPYVPIKLDELRELGYDEGRIKWFSLPHIPTHEVWEAVLRQGGGNEGDVHRIFDLALDRIGNEELWLFKRSIKCEKDIEALDIHSAGKQFLFTAWCNRILREYDRELYSPIFYYDSSRAWLSLNDEEKGKLKSFLDTKKEEAERKWEAQGKKLLSVLVESSPMLACAEDLGAVSECVPRVLTKLKILSLKVVRWERKWNEEGQPCIPFAEYPELSVCTTSVHDSSTLRQWWEFEADQNFFSAFLGQPILPKTYNPGTARIILKHAAVSASRFRIFPIIDLLHLTPRWYSEDSSKERINIPGTSNEFNWTWRLPAAISEIAKDTELINEVRALSEVK